MKRITALVLVLSMLAAGLSGCGSNEASSSSGKAAAGSSRSEPAPAQSTQQTVAVGTILNNPEKTFDDSIEHVYVRFTAPNEENKSTETELALSQITEDTYVLYVTDGMLKNHELIYECSDDGIKLYWKDVFMSEFELDTEKSQETLKQQHDTTLELFTMLTIYSEDMNGVQYRKTADTAFALSGDAYQYDVLQDGKVSGTLLIDKATGLAVSLKDVEGNSVFTVHEIKTSDLGIPQYK